MHITPTIAAIVGLTIGAAAANATPAVPNVGAQSTPNITQVWGGCGWGFHPNPWGYCVPNRRAYYRPYRYYGGGYYGPWGSPSDYMAEELNRRELWGGGYSWGY